MKVQGRGEDYGVLHFAVPKRISLIPFLLAQTELKLADLEQLVELGGIYHNDFRVLHPATELKEGDTLRVHSKPRRFSFESDILDRIVFENDDFILVNKPAGIPVHAQTDNLRENLLDFISTANKYRYYITHRLDIETSGLLILAKSKASQQKINRLIAERKIHRSYLAWVEREVQLGNFVHFMEPSPTAPKVVYDDPNEGFFRCELTVLRCMPATLEDRCDEVSVGLFSKKLYRLEIELQTGRTQQIRAQLKRLNSPILGDYKYGGSHWSDYKRIALSAYKIEIEALVVMI